MTRWSLPQTDARRRMAAVGACLGLLLGACSPSAPTPIRGPLGPLAAPSSAQPVAPSTGEAAIVWLWGERGWESLWLEPGGQEPVIRLRRAELVLPRSRGLVVYRVRSEIIRLCDPCDGCGVGGGGCQPFEKEVPRAGLEPLPTGARIALDDALPRGEECKGPAKLADVGAEILSPSAIGPYVFSSSPRHIQQCGAIRAITYPHFLTYDVEHEARRPPLAPGPEALRRMTAAARAALERDYGGERDCLVGKQVPELLAATFFYAESGELGGRYEWSHPALPFMCAATILYWVATGVALTELRDSALPPELEALRHPPSWLVPFVRAHAQDLAGVCPLPDGLDRKAAAAAFAGPLPDGTLAIAAPAP